MKKVVTRDYYIELGELREIIANYFKEKTGEEVAPCNIDVIIKQDTYSPPVFKAVHINIQEEV